jgi:3-hydroxyisobutyrate dehydrogenase
MTKTSIGFIGTGVMGASMAGHLLRAGHDLKVYTRTRARAEPLVAQGATWCETPAQVVRSAEVVITMLGYPSDVAEVYRGATGLLPHAPRGSVLVDMTTSDPELARELATAGAERGVMVLDAPVSGGDIGARNATLSIMVGGPAAGFEQVRPLLGLLGKNIVHQGAAGNGQLCKLCNQIAIAATMISVCESMAFARRVGLDTSLVLESIAAGAAGSWSLSQLMPRVLAGDTAPGFMIRHFVKDLGLALGVAERLRLELPGLALAHRLYSALLERNLGDRGTQTLLLHYLPEL